MITLGKADEDSVAQARQRLWAAIGRWMDIWQVFDMPDVPPATRTARDFLEKVSAWIAAGRVGSHPAVVACGLLGIDIRNDLKLAALPKDLTQELEAFAESLVRGVEKYHEDRKEAERQETGGPSVWPNRQAIERATWLRDRLAAGLVHSREPTPRKPQAAGPIARALGVLVEFPGIGSVSAVAEKAECHRSTLYKSDRFMEAWRAAEPSRGSQPRSGYQRTKRRVEAID